MAVKPNILDVARAALAMDADGYPRDGEVVWGNVMDRAKMAAQERIAFAREVRKRKEESLSRRERDADYVGGNPVHHDELEETKAFIQLALVDLESRVKCLEKKTAAKTHDAWYETSKVSPPRDRPVFFCDYDPDMHKWVHCVGINEKSSYWRELPPFPDIVAGVDENA